MNLPFAAAQGLWESEDGHRFADKALGRGENLFTADLCHDSVWDSVSA